MNNRRSLLMVVGTALTMTAAAAEFPERPMRIVTPFSAGSVTDIIARPIAARFFETWGQPVVVDNRGGAGGRPRAVNRVPACGM